MPAIAHLQPRSTDDGTGGISATAIGLIVGLGLVPCIILIWVVAFLFFAYPNDRNFCCMKRRKAKDTATMEEPMPGAELNQDPFHEKAVHDIPQRPFAAHPRTESGGSSGAGRLSKADPRRSGTRISKADTRMSLQSVGSVNTVQGVQEPRPYV